MTVVALETEPLELVMGPESWGRRSAPTTRPMGFGSGWGHRWCGGTRLGRDRRRVEHPGRSGGDRDRGPARTSLAAEAGLAVDDGVVVDDRLRTSDPAILAAGDVARFPHDDELIRIEHWVVAERQGQVAADVIIGDDAAYTDVPFFWSVHFDVRIRFVGYAGSHDDRTLIGDLASDGAVFYRRQGAIVAAATVGETGSPSKRRWRSSG